MARQPFYHRCDVVFSGSIALDSDAIEPLLRKAFKSVKGYVSQSAEIEVVETPKNKAGGFLQTTTILFTATREVDKKEINTALDQTLGVAEGVVKDSVRIKNFEEPEPGDPSDL